MTSISANGARGHHKFTLTVNETSTSVANNASTVSFNLQLAPIQAGWDWAITGISYKITINGTDYTGTIPSYNGTSTVTLKSGTQTVPHNADGSKTLNFSFSITDNAGMSYTPGNASASGSLVLTKIARYTSISTFTVAKKDETSVTVNWKTADIIDYLWYSKDNGSNWTGLVITEGTSGSFNIGSLNSNTQYNFKIRVRRKDSRLTTDSNAVAQTTYDYPYCITSPDFTIGNILKLDFYNPLNRSMTVKLIGNDNSTIDTWAGTGTSVTGYNAATTVNNLYASIPNSQSGKYKVSVSYGTSTKTKDGGTYKIKGTEVPTFSNFAYEDSKDTVVAVTGNKSFIVKNQSILKVTITSDNKMIAQKYATAKRYEVSCGNRTVTVNYATTDVSVDLGTISVAGNTDIIVKAYDSRGLSTTKKITINIIDYTNIIQKNTFARLNNFENETTLVTKGSFSLLSCDETNKNTIQSVRYRYAKISDNYGSSWLSLAPTISTNNYTCPDVILDLDNQSSWKIQVEIKDKLTTSTIELTVSEGIPILYLNTSRKNVGIGKLNVDGGLYSLSLAGDLILKDGKTIDERINGSFSFNTNGYQALSSGLIIQWGQKDVTLTATEIISSVDFPISFNHSCFQVFADLNDVGAQNTTLTSSVGCTAMSETQATFKIKSLENYGKDKKVIVRYFAIGY